MTTSATLIGPVAARHGDGRSPVHPVPVKLGFPSPAADFQADPVNLHELLVRTPAATFLYLAEGDSMLGEGIRDGDIIVVDRSVTPQSGDVVVASWDGNQPCCKILHLRNGCIELHSANPAYPAITLGAEQEVEVLAVVGLARQMRRGTAG